MAMLHNLEDDILRHCFLAGEFQFANNETANNKLNLEIIENRPGIRSRVIARMAHMVTAHHPDLIIATPNGANWLASDISWQSGVGRLLLDKNNETGDFSYLPHGEAAVEKSQRIVIVEDVLNKLTNTGKVYRLPGVAERTEAVIGIWDRNPDRESTLPVPVEALITHAIPNMLPEDSPLLANAR